MKTVESSDSKEQSREVTKLSVLTTLVIILLTLLYIS